jgi:predicted helicase
MGKVEKTPNLNPEIVKRIASAVGDGTPTMPTCSTRSTRLDNPPTPEDIFHYIYAVLHAPQYRARYKEFLKVDFPRIPYPANGEVFRRLAEIGERLVAVHLLKDPKVRDMFAPYANFPVSGDNRIEFLRWEKCEDLRDSAIPQPPKGRIYVNSEQYIDNVPASAWEFFVGGYQPAQKWLKDRKGRVLTSDDLLHYKSIISALVETRRLMDELAGVPLAAKLGTLV